MNTAVIFIGGPGRSGTSFVADRVGTHDQVATFRDVELKIFGELDGLMDLRTSLVERFSPNRGELSVKNFTVMFNTVCAGDFGQPTLNSLVSAEALTGLLSRFLRQLQPDGYIDKIDHLTFNRAARALLAGLAQLAMESKPGSNVFLEKTPHNLLQSHFLHEIASSARYLHIYRNPMATAVSLLRQPWGPDKLENACIWVGSYFRAWHDALAWQQRMDLPIMDLKIETIAAAPAQFGIEVCRHLELDDRPGLFDGVNGDTLEGWRTQVNDEDRIILHERLGEICAALGYDSVI